jgi:uncharacterized protein
VKVVIAGGTGFLGSSLARSLVADRHEVVVLSRSVSSLNSAAVRYVEWNGRGLDDWAREIDGADAVVNFSGAPIAPRRWTPARKHLLRASRIEPTAALVAAMRQAERRPPVFLNASAVGYYGDRGEDVVTEDDPPGHDFLARLVADWEAAAIPARDLGVRVVRPRIGVVLGTDGALPMMAMPVRFFVGGPIGSGRQWVPWVHVDDVVGMFRFAIEQPELEGPINVCAADPVRNRDLMGAIGRALHRPLWFPVPGPLLRVFFGEVCYALLTGQRVVPTVAQRLGYVFREPVLLPAVRKALAA